MSGHSKWHNIRVKKTASDAKRGKIYTRHARLVEMAARNGTDPSMNSALRTAIDNAKAENVPNTNIERAIKKGSGELKGEQMSEVMYAAYLPVRSSTEGGAEAGGPGGVAVLIECLTDNRNRTLANVKMAINKNGGNFAESSSVVWMFDRKGVVVARPNEGQSLTIDDDLELTLIDAGAEDIDYAENVLTVMTNLTSWTTVRDLLKEKGLHIETCGAKYVPNQTQSVDAATMEKVSNFIEALEEDDDVSEVHVNAVLNAS